jgi:thioesterase domain-containing protein
MSLVSSNEQQQLLRETETFFHAQIPITAAMGVRVEAYDSRQLVLTAPLETNHNHLGTAFGGSLAAVATLAGYGFLWLELGDCTAHLIIRDSALSYRRPVRREIRAICRRPQEAELTAFKAAFAHKGKGRIRLRVSIEEDKEVAVEFEGTFVAMK